VLRLFINNNPHAQMLKDFHSSAESLL